MNPRRLSIASNLASRAPVACKEIAVPSDWWTTVGHCSTTCIRRLSSWRLWRRLANSSFCFLSVSLMARRISSVSSSLASCFSAASKFLSSYWLRVISTREMDWALRFYTKLGPMTRIYALYPGAYAPGYSADSRVIRPNSYIRGIRARGYRQICGSYDPGSLRATLRSPLMPQHFKWNESETHFLSWCFK